VGGDTGNIDDAAATALCHGRPKLLAGKQDPSHQIQIKVRVPVLEPDLLKRIFRRHRYLWIVSSGCIDENGGRAKFRLQLLMGLGQAAAGNRVGGEKLGRSSVGADGFDAGGAAFGVSSQNCHAGAGFGQALGQRTAQDTRRSDDDRHVLGKIK
jgi:hypothetical protein